MGHFCVPSENQIHFNALLSTAGGFLPPRILPNPIFFGFILPPYSDDLNLFIVLGLNEIRIKWHTASSIYIQIYF